MKKLLPALLVVAGAVGFGAVFYMKGGVASRYSVKDLQDIAAQANKSLPVMVDPYTRLDMVVASGRLLEKKYTLVSAPSSEALVAELKTKLFPVLKAQSCQNTQSMNLYRSDVAEAFSYADMNGRHLATLKVDRSSCE